MPDDFARAFAFLLKADMAGTRAEPFRYGTAISMPELPLRYDSNYLLADRLPAGINAGQLAGEADRTQGGAGLEHRAVLVPNVSAAARLEPEFEALGWTIRRFVLMANRRAPQQPIDTSIVAETSAAALYEARAEQMSSYPWSSPEVVRQLLAARELIRIPTRYLGIFVDGVPASWAELYAGRGIAQVEAVATAEAFRNRGYASAVVMRAVEEGRSAGAGLVFLAADADDWPQELYRRLGFDPLGRYTTFLLPGAL